MFVLLGWNCSLRILLRWIDHQAWLRRRKIRFRQTRIHHHLIANSGAQVQCRFSKAALRLPKPPTQPLLSSLESTVVHAQNVLVHRSRRRTESKTMCAGQTPASSLEYRSSFSLITTRWSTRRRRRPGLLLPHLRPGLILKSMETMSIRILQSNIRLGNVCTVRLPRPLSGGLVPWVQRRFATRVACVTNPGGYSRSTVQLLVQHSLQLFTQTHTRKWLKWEARDAVMVAT